MGLIDFTERHAGKLFLVGTIGFFGSIYYGINETIIYDRKIGEIKQSVPEYARLEKVNKDISSLESEFNRGATLKDLILLTTPENTERNKYLEMQTQYNNLQEEKRTLTSNPEIKKLNESIADNSRFPQYFLITYFASIIPTSLGIGGLMSRPKTEKKREQKPFLIANNKVTEPF